jgi:transposase-like protein
MASLSGEKTLAELSAEFGVHPTMISNWKQELVKRAGELFAREIVVEPEDITCPCCGGAMHVIGEDRSQRLDVIPAQ